ncbi:MAG: hypothetical protein LBL01_04810, partial [Bifidobacteriaceae bacterium]|nr:hypothetical protein [Bifidobacteriaceae bacterium]
PTGAGVVFIVALAYARLAGWPLPQAVRLAVLSSALSTERLGGSAGAPTWGRLRRWLAAAGGKARQDYAFVDGPETLPIRPLGDNFATPMPIERDQE